MEKYYGLNPEQKIEKYLKQRQKELKLIKLKPIGLFLFFFLITSFVSINVFDKFNIWFATLTPLILVFLMLSRSTFEDKKASFLYENAYYEPLNIATKEEIKKNHSLSSDIRIINTICNGKNYKGELLFGKQKSKVIFPIKPYPTQMLFFIENGIRKNEPCFIICINSFENPVAVFRGKYNGNNYLTYNG